LQGGLGATEEVLLKQALGEQSLVTFRTATV
jgi:hypothetical protein